MKHQYLGDTRDLFKYDLLEHLMDHFHPRTFAFIAMLTRADLAQAVFTKTDYEKWRYAEIGTSLLY